MSETEALVGKLIPSGRTVAEEMAGIEFPSYYDKSKPEDVYEYFRDIFYEKKILIDGVVFDVNATELEDGDIFEAKQEADGTIAFTVKYYNGGCSFNEAIELAINNIQEEVVEKSKAAPIDEARIRRETIEECAQLCERVRCRNWDAKECAMQLRTHRDMGWPDARHIVND